MNSFIRGLGGGIGRAIGRIVGLLIVAILGYVILSTFDLDIKSIVSKVLFIDAKAITETNISSGTKAGSHCSTHPSGSMCTSQVYPSGGNPCGNGDAYCVTYNSAIVNNLVMSMDFYVNTSLGPNTKNTITIKGNYFSSGNYNCMSSHYSCTATRVSSTQINVNFNSTSSSVIDAEFFITKANGSSINDSSHSYRITSVILFENPQDSGSSGSTFDDSGIINNANQNTQDIINNNNTNTESINNNVNNGIFSIITELANRCTNLISPNLFTNGIYAENNGVFVDKSSNTTINNVSVDTGFISFTTTDSWWGISNTDYIPITPQGTYHLKFNSNLIHYMVDIYYYNSNKQYMSYSQTWNIDNITFTAPVNASYIRVGFSSNNYGNYTISNLTLNADNSAFCPYGSTISKLDNIGGILGGLDTGISNVNDTITDTNDILTDDSIDTTNSESFFSDFNNNMHGLSAIITLPLNALRSFANSSCSPLHIPIPFTNKYLDIPCMSSIYNTYIPTLYQLIQTLWYGILAYLALTDIFYMVKGFKDPDSDKIEVLDL